MKLKGKITLLLAIAICATIADVSGSINEIPEEVSYNEFKADWNAGKIADVYYKEDAAMIRYTLKTDDYENLTIAERQKLSNDELTWKGTTNPAYENFRKDLLESGIGVHSVDFTPVSITLWGFALGGAVYFLLVYLLWRMVSMTDIQENPLVTKTTTKLSFNDVIGHDEFIEDFKFLSKILKNPKLGNEIGAEIPKGILLTGPPGTGKTMLAKALAAEAGVPFFEISGADFIEVYVGTGAKRVRELFKLARKNAPCVVFIDEVDAIGSRNNSDYGGSAEHKQTINQLLKEMDGFRSSSGILVLGATNCPDDLDEALKRAGRFDKQIEIAPPKTDDVRVKMFKHYLANKKVEKGIDLTNLARQTQGLTGADIKQICNESALIALTNNKSEIDFDCLIEAIDRCLIHGNKSKDKASDRENEIVRYHEAGHAVCRWVLNEEIIRISVAGSTSGVGGFVIGPTQESMMSKDELERLIIILYGGRCSEAIKFGKEMITIGASNDIKQATEMLYKYSNVLGFVSDAPLIDYSMFNDKALELNSLKETALRLQKRCEEILIENYDLVEKLATALKDKPTLTGSEIELLFKEDK